MMIVSALLAVAAAGTVALASQEQPPLEVVGVTVTPHVAARSLRYATPRGRVDGALVRLFIRNRGATSIHANEATIDGRFPLKQVLSGAWTWHDTPDVWPDVQRDLPPGALTVWTFDASHARDVPRGEGSIAVVDWTRDAPYTASFRVPKEDAWLSSVTFLGPDDGPYPDHVVLHVRNAANTPLRIEEARLWLPPDLKRYRVFLLQPPVRGLRKYPADGVIPAGDEGCAVMDTGRLPLTYCVLEVTARSEDGAARTLWARLRIRRETFDISGGWIGGATRDGTSALTHEPYLKTLRRMHIDTGHIGPTPGYTDQTGPGGLYTRFPIKFFGSLRPIERYDRDDMLPRVHAVEALGEPQLVFDAGEMLPQEVWEALDQYGSSRLPTTVTLNDETTWRFYAGLSDFPHFDAYRVSAPSVDTWSLYDRWGGARIAWGAPLETIGDLCRSLREMSRPAPIAAWSQGPGDWEVYGGRLRTSPTPDELRVQAYQALSSRITSLYWFNPDLRSIVRYRDTIDPMTRIGREIKMLEPFYLEGGAYDHRRMTRGGRLDWDIATIAGPRGALLFALDLDYKPDLKERVFRFGEPCEARFAFRLPAYLRGCTDVFRVDADGITDVRLRRTRTGVVVEDHVSKVAVYVAAPDRRARAGIEEWRRALVAEEQATGFDPAHSDADFAVLQALAPER